MVINSISFTNSMDITRMVNIETILSSNTSVTRLFKGYVSHNNVVSKQMKNIFSKPRIVIIMGSIEMKAFT